MLGSLAMDMRPMEIMILKPQRVQRKRSKGWRLPPNTVCVTRGTAFGNPFIVNPHVEPGSKSGACYICVPTVEDAVDCFRLLLQEDTPAMREFRAKIRAELRGKNVACFCGLDSPCHGDILLQVANEEDDDGGR